VKIVLFTRVFNLFDIRNQTDVDTSTGRSDFTLEEKDARAVQLYVNSVDQWFTDPTRYTEPRRIEFGMNLEF
jgi:hypothetical protein